jgi:hypothetical protein
MRCPIVYARVTGRFGASVPEDRNMAVPLKGSCRCGSVKFSLRSHTPHPYQLCYCSICRKTAGGGGFAVNIMGVTKTLKVTGKGALGVYQADITQDDGHCETSTAQRHFCTSCAAALWLFSPEYPDTVYPLASAIDSKLPVPPAKVHLMLKFKPDWVVPDVGPDDQTFDLYPNESIEDWHRTRGLWLK